MRLTRAMLFASLLMAGFAYTSHGHAERLTVCHGYSCHFKGRLILGAGDMRQIASIMRQGNASPAAERRAVSRLVRFYERRAAVVIGIRDRAKSDFGAGRERGQMDCVDESTNTTALLKLIEKRDFLKHHKVQRRASRGFFADGRYPHFTAVLQDRSGQKWAVDSWYEPAGGAPDIMPLGEWKARGVAGRR